MTTNIQRGTPQFPAVTGSVQPSSRSEMDAAIKALREQKDTWVMLPISGRIVILDRLLRDFANIAPRWVAASLQAKGIAADSLAHGEEWGAGVYPMMKMLRQLHHSLADLARNGHPTIPGKLKTRPDGQVVAPVFPLTVYDRLFYRGLRAELWMEPGVTPDTLEQTQAAIYRDKRHAGKVALVLGAGNVASIAPSDVLNKLFLEDQVVILKMNPVNAYLGPLIEESFRALIDPGFLRVVYGGSSEGAYLCNHPLVEEIHITGSDKTFDAIVFGTATEGAARKASHEPLLQKRITAELSSVSPVIIVPGPWSEGDLSYQAEHIVSMLTNNAGFNCNATRVIVQHSGWKQRDQLVQKIRNILASVPPRNAYYPGAKDRQRLYLAKHPGAEQFGDATADQLPWTLIQGVDANKKDDVCFTTESFCGLFAETALDADDTPTYIDRAVAFCNERLWGSLNATILVHPSSLKQPEVAVAVERAVAGLRYGSVGVNCWSGTSFVLATTAWGAFPGHPLYDIQSGMGVVHNTLMLARPQKTVLRSPFRVFPKLTWFVTQGNKASKVFPKLVEFEAAPSPLKVPAIVWEAIAG